MVYFARIMVAKFRIMYPLHKDDPRWPRRTERSVSFIKIGKSIDPVARVQYLQDYEYYKPMQLLAVMPGDVEEEKMMHARFAHLRIEKEPRMPPTEWFYPARELMDFVHSLQESKEKSLSAS